MVPMVGWIITHLTGLLIPPMPKGDVTVLAINLTLLTGT